VSAAPDYCEPTEGWRVWLVVEDRGALRLASVLYPTIWTPREEAVARCELSSGTAVPHLAPSGECTCGLYAAASLTAAIAYFDGCGQKSYRPVYRVIGRVSLWGRVIEGDRGWRASHAYPSRLYVPAHPLGGESSISGEDVGFALADYGVPVELVDVHTKARVVRLLAGPDSAVAA
jgi:hypothetical protein